MRRIGIGIALATIVAVGFAGGSAEAEDANSTPPDTRLLMLGDPNGASDHNVLGPNSLGLAIFTTEREVNSYYVDGDQISVSCSVDGMPVACEARFQLCCLFHTAVPKASLLKCRRVKGRKGDRQRRRHPRRRCRHSSGGGGGGGTIVDESNGRGYFQGRIATPPGLTDGVHTVSVTATDEDGTEVEPATDSAILDLEPPPSPVLLSAPPTVTRNRKPIFSYALSDNHELGITSYARSEEYLVRTDPHGPVRRGPDISRHYLNQENQQCSSPIRCDIAVFPAFVRNLNGKNLFGTRERLRPGAYEIGVRAKDMVQNVSAWTTYDFRVLKTRHN